MVGASNAVMKDTGHEKKELLGISFHLHSTFILATSSTAASMVLLHCHILSPIIRGSLFSLFLY